MTGLYRHHPPGRSEEERKADRRRTTRFLVRTIGGCTAAAVLIATLLNIFAK